MTTNYPGIDYSLGRSNFDPTTGIHYGVIHSGDVLQAWADSSEAEYGPPCCPHCGNQADELSAFGETFDDGIPDDWTVEKYECEELACADCQHVFGAESAYGDEPLGFYLVDDEYHAHQDGDDCDIFITQSPYYTNTQFCSPCAPGAGHLGNPCPDGPKTYCFGHDWFDDNRAPYPVYRVSDGSIVEPNV